MLLRLPRAVLVLAFMAAVVFLLALVLPWTDALTPLGCTLTPDDCRQPRDLTPVIGLGALCLTGVLVAIAGLYRVARATQTTPQHLTLAATALLIVAAAGVYSTTVRMDYSAWKTAVGVNAFD